MTVYQVMSGISPFGIYPDEKLAAAGRDRHAPYYPNCRVVSFEVEDVSPADFIASPPCDICGTRQLYYMDSGFRCVNCY